MRANPNVIYQLIITIITIKSTFSCANFTPSFLLTADQQAKMAAGVDYERFERLLAPLLVERIVNTTSHRKVGEVSSRRVSKTRRHDN